jgi:protein-S-isoprenylcysteine O-methyltransferase Ste14
MSTRGAILTQEAGNLPDTPAFGNPDERSSDMSWIPPFEIGLLNAWILMLFFPLQPLIMIVIDKAVGGGDIWKKMGDWPVEEKAKRANLIYMVLEVALIAYSIFLPLKLGTAWFTVGLSVYLVGLVMIIATLISAAATPPGLPFIRGPYRISRHPGYLSQSLLFVGVALTTASWIFMLLSLVLWFLLAFVVADEEQSCLENFGEAYREYMKRTPRWVGIPKPK